MSDVRPLIGVTGPDTWLPLSWWFIAWAIRRAGGRPLRMTPRHPRDSRACAGLVISGGDDIDPGLYLPDGHETAPTDTARDVFEMDPRGTAAYHCSASAAAHS